MTRSDRWALAILAAAVAAFAAVTIPAGIPCSRHSAALYMWEVDGAVFVVPPLMDIYSGSIPPAFSVYGHFPAYCAALLFLPVLLPIKLLHGSIDYFHFVMAMRLTQVLMGALTLIFAWRIAALAMSRWAALAVVALLLTLPELYRWTIDLHPDIHQCAMLMVAVFYLIRHQQTGSRRDLCVSAAAAGLAMASKYYGVFILPAAALACYSAAASSRPAKEAARMAFRSALMYGLIAGAVFLAVNARILLSAGEFRKWIGIFGSYAAAPAQRGELLAGKIANLGSSSLFGLTFIVIYLVALATMGAADGRRWRKGRFAPHPYQTIHITVACFAGYYLAFYNDAWNLYHGERYALPFVCLAAIPVVHLVASMLRQRRLRIAAVALIALIAVTQVRRVQGRPFDGYWPTPAIVHKELFNSVALSADPADQDLVRSSYEAAGKAMRLRRNLAPAAARELWTFWRTRSWLLNKPVTIRQMLIQHYQREDCADFRTRQWVIDHVRPGAAIYTQSGLNLLPTTSAHVLYAPNDDLPTRSIAFGAFIQPDRIAELRPDYIFTRSQSVADEIVARYPQYALLDTIWRRRAVYALGLRDFSVYRVIDRYGAAAGDVEEIVQTGSARYTVSGRATDPETGRPASEVLFVADGQVLRAVTVTAGAAPAPAFGRWTCDIDLGAAHYLPQPRGALQFLTTLADRVRAAPLDWGGSETLAARGDWTPKPLGEYAVVPAGAELDGTIRRAVPRGETWFRVEGTARAGGSGLPRGIMVVRQGRTVAARAFAPPPDIGPTNGTELAWSLDINTNGLPAPAAPVEVYAVAADNARAVRLPAAGPDVDLTLNWTIKPLTQYTVLEGVGGRVNMASRGQRLVLNGWAVDEDSGLPAAAILVVHEGRILAQGRTGLAREDVARYYRRPGYTTAGWEIEVDAAALPLPETPVRIFAVMGDNAHVRPIAAESEDSREVFLLLRPRP